MTRVTQSHAYTIEAIGLKPSDGQHEGHASAPAAGSPAWSGCVKSNATQVQWRSASGAHGINELGLGSVALGVS